MTPDPLILSRLQFFWVIGWRILLALGDTRKATAPIGRR